MDNNTGDFGLMDYNARWYSPTLGRFTQPDTIIPGYSNPQNFNRYSYVNNRPINFADPTGHCADGVSTIVCVLGYLVITLAAIDYGWTAYDAISAANVITNPNSTREQIEDAERNLALAISMEIAEPDEWLPFKFPTDDLARKGITWLDEAVGTLGKTADGDGVTILGRGSADEVYDLGVEAGYLDPEWKDSVVDSFADGDVAFVMPGGTPQYTRYWGPDAAEAGGYYGTLYHDALLDPRDAQDLFALPKTNNATNVSIGTYPGSSPVMIGPAASKVGDPSFWSHASGGAMQVYFPGGLYDISKRIR